MEKVKLGEIFEYLPKSKFKAGEGKEEGKYKFFTSSNIQNKFIDEFIYDGEYLIFGTGGKASINYCNDKFSTSTDNFVVKVHKDFCAKLIYLYFKHDMTKLEKGFKGASIKHISKEYINQLMIPKYNYEQQIKIVNELDKVQEIIDIKRKQLQHLDKLIKSQFVEIFGVPLENNKRWNVDKTINTCKKITDGSHFSPKDIKTGIPMLSVKDMRNDGFHYNECKHISNEDYEILKSQDCIPKKNDVLISKDGSYFYYGFVVEEEKKQAILSSIAMLRPDTEIINPYYLRYYLMSKEVVDMVSRNYVTGAALKRVVLKGIKEIPIMIPPIKLQNEFEEKVRQFNKQKQQIQKSLNETQMLQESLMNKYFGG